MQAGERGRENGLRRGTRQDFDNQVISSFGEAFNNAAIHSYRGRPLGNVEIEIDVAPVEITLRICRPRRELRPTQVVKEPVLDALPESRGSDFSSCVRSWTTCSYQTGTAGAPQRAVDDEAPNPAPTEPPSRRVEARDELRAPTPAQ